MTDVLVVFGTRLEAIKLAPVIAELRSRPEIRMHVCVTAQHRHRLDQVLPWFRIVPEYDFVLMEANQSLCRRAGKVLARVGEVLDQVLADVVLVQGDTTTTMAAALAGLLNRIGDSLVQEWP